MEIKNNSRLQRKGYVFILDLILSMTIFFVVLFVSLFFFSSGNEVTLSEYQLLVIGSDIVTLMDAEKAFDSLDYYLIRDRMQKLVPTNYEMLIRLEGNFSTVEVGGDIPQKRFMLAGRKVGLTDNDVFLKITYFIWMRVQ